MNKSLINKLLPHFIAVMVFLIVALVYCKPALEGKVLQQGDVVQWKAMAQNSFEYKARHGHLPLWTNGMFSGMPAYQIALEPEVAVNPNIFYGISTFFLPKPIGFFFAASICFYLLTQVFRVNPYVGIIGGLAYAYVTYNMGIVAAGHDTKMNTIALAPGLLAGMLLCYQRKYLWGASITAIFTALLIGLNHIQIVYYTALMAGFLTIAYGVHLIKSGQLKHFLLSLAIVIGAGAIGLMANAVTLLTVLESSKTSIRGGTELPDKNSSNTGLSKDYALSYSMSKPEPFVMMFPNMFGGSGTPIEEKVDNPKAIDVLQSMPPQIGNQLQSVREAYWGGLGPIPPNAPAYVGAVICFLALIGFFILDNPLKWGVLAACIVAIPMSWGSYFESFNAFLLNYLPFYNKFRVPSMILFIPTLLLCLMAVLTLHKIITDERKELLWKNYKKGLILTGAVFVVALLIYLSSDFISQIDKDVTKQVANADPQIKEYVRQLQSALKDDRQSLFLSTYGRTFMLVALAAGLLWFSIRRRVNAWIPIACIGLLAVIDVMTVDSKYLNSDNYVMPEEYESNFTPTPIDEALRRDTSYYRVFDLRNGLGSLTQNARTSYFHKSISGYHPAKLSIYQDLIEHQLGNYQFLQPSPVVNMLNVKYLMLQDNTGRDTVITNDGNLGAAWFVKGVRFEKTPAAVMNGLTSFSPADTAILFEKDRNNIMASGAPDPNSRIQLINNDNDEVNYTSTSATPQFAVFSEVYYDHQGWIAYVDNKEVPIIRTNYVLRGLNIPAGQHKIRFSFRPNSFYTGEKIALVAGILLYLLFIAAIVQSYRSRKTLLP